jgi:hypothetical protein
MGRGSRAFPDELDELVEPDVSAVILFQRAANAKSASGYCEHKGVEQRHIVVIERDVQEDVAPILRQVQSLACGRSDSRFEVAVLTARRIFSMVTERGLTAGSAITTSMKRPVRESRETNTFSDERLFLLMSRT